MPRQNYENEGPNSYEGRGESPRYDERDNRRSRDLREEDWPGYGNESNNSWGDRDQRYGGDRDYDEHADYRRWRADHMRELDEHYNQFQQSKKSQKQTSFADEFSGWLKNHQGKGTESDSVHKDKPSSANQSK